MENSYIEEQEYIKAKKKVKEIKDFYMHLAAYILVNIVLTTIFIVGNINNGDTFIEALGNR
ncbi:MAG: hypothetical protein ACJA1B_002300 [Polaribacter sp.]|jgi:hypothetical protein